MRSPYRRLQVVTAWILACAVVAVPAWAVVFDATTMAAPRPGADGDGATLLLTDQGLLTAPAFIGARGLLLGLARDPLTGDLYTTVIQQGGSFLARLDPHTGSLTQVGPPLTVTLRSIAFDSQGHLFGFAYCDQNFANQLFQFDRPSWAITGELGSLDVDNVADCSTLYAGAVIAIDPGDDSLYLAANSAAGGLLIDRFDSFLVPTTLVQGGPAGVVILPGFTVTAATFAAGKLWVANNLDFYLGGYLLGFPRGHFDQSSYGSPSFDPHPFGGAAPIFGMAEARQPCVDSSTATCLFHRFRVEVSYDARPAGGSGVVKPILESQETARYAFTDPKEIDLVVRMVNACATTAKRWRVWGGGPTNVGVQIKVTDTQTGKTKTYANAKGKLFQTFFDASAFVCP